MIQQVEISIRVGLEGTKPYKTMLLVPINGMGVEEIPASKHWKDEREIARALRRIAARIEKGASFELK